MANIINSLSRMRAHMVSSGLPPYVAAFAAVCIMCGVGPLLVSWSPASAAVFTVGSLSAPGNGGGGSVCMDVSRASLNLATPVVAFDCHASPNQQFELSGTTIYAMGGTRCIDVLFGGTTTGTHIDSTTCNGTAAQVWMYNGAAHLGSFFNPHSGKCLDARTMQSGLVLVIDPCNGSPGQLWQIK
jgi:hypothetical protein